MKAETSFRRNLSLIERIKAVIRPADDEDGAAAVLHLVHDTPTETCTIGIMFRTMEQADDLVNAALALREALAKQISEASGASQPMDDTVGRAFRQLDAIPFRKAGGPR